VSKRRLGIAVIGIALALCGCTKSPEAKLVGEWKGTSDSGDSATMIFNRDHTFRMVMGNFVVDGQTYGAGVELKWHVDATHDPIWLDVIANDQSGQRPATIALGIIRFVNDRTLQLRMLTWKMASDKFERPTNFSSDDKNQLVLVKQ
jgi:hypothetical protein